MDKKASVLVLLLLLFLIDNLMVQIEANEKGKQKCYVPIATDHEQCLIKRCTQQCRNKGYKKGICFNGGCQCKSKNCGLTGVSRSPNVPIGDDGDGHEGFGEGGGRFGGGNEGVGVGGGRLGGGNEGFGGGGGRFGGGGRGGHFGGGEGGGNLGGGGGNGEFKGE